MGVVVHATRLKHIITITKIAPVAWFNVLESPYDTKKAA